MQDIVSEGENGLDEFRSNEGIVREIFTRLVNIDVSKYTKKKNNQTYLPWADAYRLMMIEFPDATIQEYWFEGSDGLRHPYYRDETGYYVTVGISIKGIEKREKLPVIDYRNKPIEGPNSFDINTTTKRCWVKAMARWGLGLYIYAGEEIPGEVVQSSSSSPLSQRARSQSVVVAAVVSPLISGKKKAELEEAIHGSGLTVSEVAEKLSKRFSKQVPVELSKWNEKQGVWLLENLEELKLTEVS